LTVDTGDKMTDEEINDRIKNDPKFINIKRFGYNIDNLLERYPEGAPMRTICQALDMSEEEVEELYQNVVKKLQKILT
jgi:hypothetical protein